MAEPSMSMPVATRPRWGLIAIVLVLDAGLATAGAIMLGKGLAKPEHGEAAPAKSSPPAAGSAHADTAPAGSAAAPPPAPPPAASNGSALGDLVASVQPPAAEATASGAVPTPPTRRDPKRKSSATSATTPPAKPDPRPGVVPQDPYDPARALASEIELQASRSQAAFDQCYLDASAQAPIHGELHIQFSVQPDGRVSNVAAVRNDPSSSQLAGCVGAIISRWSFAARPANAANFVRPFIYP